jgi:hypothetical protein
LFFVARLRLPIRRQVFPQAITPPFGLVIECLTAPALYQTLALATVGDDDDAQFGVDFALAIPVAAGCAHFDFGRDNQFFAHDFYGG